MSHMDEPESPWLDPAMQYEYRGGPPTPKAPTPKAPTPKAPTPKPESPVIEGWERKGTESPKV